MNLAQELLRPVTPMRNWTTVEHKVKVCRTSSYHLRAVEILDKLDVPKTSEQIIAAMGWPQGTTEKRLTYLLNCGIVERKKRSIPGKNSRFMYAIKSCTNS